VRFFVIFCVGEIKTVDELPEAIQMDPATGKGRSNGERQLDRRSTHRIDGSFVFEIARQKDSLSFSPFPSTTLSPSRALPEVLQFRLQVAVAEVGDGRHGEEFERCVFLFFLFFFGAESKASSFDVDEEKNETK